jgi:hypothetical protein
MKIMEKAIAYIIKDTKYDILIIFSVLFASKGFLMKSKMSALLIINHE